MPSKQQPFRLQVSNNLIIIMAKKNQKTPSTLHELTKQAVSSINFDKYHWARQTKVGNLIAENPFVAVIQFAQSIKSANHARFNLGVEKDRIASHTEALKLIANNSKAFSGKYLVNKDGSIQQRVKNFVRNLNRCIGAKFDPNTTTLDEVLATVRMLQSKMNVSKYKAPVKAKTKAKAKPKAKTTKVFVDVAEMAKRSFTVQKVKAVAKKVGVAYKPNTKKADIISLIADSPKTTTTQPSA